MARTRTLEQLTTLARLYADARGAGVATTGFITDTEAHLLINLQLSELYDLLLSARGQDYYITDDTISIVSGTSEYNLPTDFYQLKTLTLEWGDQERELVRPINSVAARTPLVNEGDWGEWSTKGYRLRGSVVEFVPSPTSAVTCRIEYVPTFTDLVASPGSPNTFDCVNGWEKLVALGAAMEMLEIEEKGAGAILEARYQQQYRRIQAMADDRDADNPTQIEDVCPEGRRDIWYPTGKVYIT